MEIAICFYLLVFYQRTLITKVSRKIPQELTILSQSSSKISRGKKDTAKQDTIKDITSDSQVNSHLPYMWSPASVTLNIYFTYFPLLYLTRITKHNHIPHLKPKNQNSNKITGGFNEFAVDQPLPLVLLWFLIHLVVWFAWKIPSSYVHYLRNIEIKIILET